MDDLASRSCIPCHGGVPRLGAEEIQKYLSGLDDWRAVKEHHLSKSYKFTDFKEALAFVNQVGEIAEAEGHHPDICFGWARADVTIYTHAIDGLSESDFILAAKIDRLK